MHVWVLSHLRDSIGTRTTVTLFEKAGCDVVHVDPNSIHLALDPGSQTPLLTLPQTQPPDLVYTRLGSSAPARAIDVVRHLESMGLRCFNSSASLEMSRDKFRSYQLMVNAGLPIPRTVLVTSDVAMDSVVGFLPGPPWIIKVPMSTKGAGVCIVDTYRSMNSVVGTLLSVHDRILIQEFVEESAGTDIRVFVMDGKAILAVRRRASSPDEFRSNVALGGSDVGVELTDEMRQIAEEAAAVHSLSVAGIDLLEGENGFFIAEVNGSPGLFGPHRQFPEVLEAAFADLVENIEEPL